MDTEQADGQVAVAQAEFADVFGDAFEAGRPEQREEILTDEERSSKYSKRKDKRGKGSLLELGIRLESQKPVLEQVHGEEQDRGWDGRADATAAPGHGSTVVEARA